MHLLLFKKIVINNQKWFFHSNAFHVSCLSRDGCCSICKEPLEQMISNKVSQFNEGLLKNGCTESDGESSDSETEDDTATVGNSEARNANAEQYYTSRLWEQKVNSSLSAYSFHGLKRLTAFHII